MTPAQKVKWLILAADARLTGGDPPPYPLADAEERHQALVDAGEHWDATSEVRGGMHETGLPGQWSRHYESKSVAAQLPDGSWVGWTYWFGGGKYGAPEAIDWIDDAYDVQCRDEVRTVQVFSLPVVQPEAAPA